MLTLFSIPKSFQGNIGIIQRNAVRSWTLLQPKPQVFLFGDEHGTADVVKEMHIEHVPDVARNEYGTPLISDVFQRVEKLAGKRLLCYVNADVILMNDFVDAVRSVSELSSPFLMVGRRWNIEITDPYDFQDGWENRLRSYSIANGRQEPATGIDYFVFPRGIAAEMPPFAVGRPAWDNWFIYYALFCNYPVIDATPVAMVIHQNHGYSHVPQGTGKRWEGPEAERNSQLAGGFEHLFTIKDANLILTQDGIRKPKWTKERIFRYLYTRAILSPQPDLWLRTIKILFAPRNVQDYFPKLTRFFSPSE